MLSFRSIADHPRGPLVLLSVFLASSLAAASVCRWLGSLHEYGQHTRAQVVLATGLCAVIGAWAAAELSALYPTSLPSEAGGSTEFELVPTSEPAPVTLGAESADKEITAESKGEEAVAAVRHGSGYTVDAFLEHLDASLAPLRAAAELAVILAFMYLCDRTDFFQTGHKVQDTRIFWGLWGLICVAALFTLTKLESGKPMQREQTDEWKGWMQLMFLMYHYFNQKSVYNAIRVYIAAYVFMTGYGNWSLYIRGKSFSIRRSMQMLFRLNFLGFFVCVALTNEYMLYYICAMHTLFTVFVILALYIKHESNENSKVLHFKVVLTLLSTILIYDGPDVIFRSLFGTLPVVRPLFAFHDPLHPEFTDEMHEWHFRSGLDRFVWIVGMVFALHYSKFEALFDWLQSLEPMQNLLRSCAVLVPLILAFLIWIQYFFTLDKYSYNHVHAYTSSIPILVYLVVRNISKWLRQRYLFLFAYVGRVTLETYILQFHVWMKTTGLNGSPKKLMVWIPDSMLPAQTAYFANFAITTVVYLFVSVRLSKLTIVLRDALIPEDKCILTMIWTSIVIGALSLWLASYAIV